MAKEFAVGKIGAPWGVNGFVKVQSYSGEIDHLKKLKDVVLRKGNREESIKFDAVEKKHGAVVVRISGISDRDEVKRFSGWEIWVASKNAARRKRGEYYISDLIGCNVVVHKEVVGSVTGVSDIGYVDLLEVTTGQKESSFVPFQEEFVGKVDIKARTIELKERWILD